MNKNKEEIDYLILINKQNPLPSDWESKVQIVHMTNSLGVDVPVEAKTYQAYLKLKSSLELEGIYINLDSAQRTVSYQKKIMNEFIQKYGPDYAKNYVATPGYSEHHTGLALDLYLKVDGVDVVENEDLMKHIEIWTKIHEKISDYGFILRFPEDKKHITGCSYEPWHIRYIDDVELAKDIMKKGITFEEYKEKK